PITFGQQIVRMGERHEPTFECFPCFCRFTCVLETLVGNALHKRERVLYSMIELCNQQLARLFGFLALSYIDVYADHPQEIATTRKTRTGLRLRYPDILLRNQGAP